MNRHLLILTLPLLLTGCAADDTAGSPPACGDAITFETRAQSVTRGTPVTGTTLPESATFSIYATKERDGSRGVFIDHTTGGNTVAYSSGAWRTATPYYWPYNSFTVRFYAVCPASASTVQGLTTTPVLTYTGTAGSIIDGSTDLLCAAATDTRRDRTADSNAPVVLDFRHALTQVAFEGKLSDEFRARGWHVWVKGVTLHNVNGAGTLDLASGSWTTAATPVLTDIPFVMAGPDIEITESATALTSTIDIPMLMPQRLTKWDHTAGRATAGNGCYLTLSCHVTDADGRDLHGTADSYLTTYVPFSVSPSDSEASWEPARRYTYTLSFGAGYDDSGVAAILPIAVTAVSVVPWTPHQIDDPVSVK